MGIGLLVVLAATVLVVALYNPAIPVAAVGVAAIGARLATGRERPRHVAQVLGAPVLVGLFGVAVALGKLGRVAGRTTKRGQRSVVRSVTIDQIDTIVTKLGPSDSRPGPYCDSVHGSLTIRPRYNRRRSLRTDR